VLFFLINQQKHQCNNI